MSSDTQSQHFVNPFTMESGEMSFQAVFIHCSMLQNSSMSPAGVSGQFLGTSHSSYRQRSQWMVHQPSHQEPTSHATWCDYQICVWFRNSDFSLSLFSDPWKHLKPAFLFSLEEYLSSIPDLSLLFDHEPFCHLTFLIAFKYNYTGNFFFLSKHPFFSK